MKRLFTSLLLLASLALHAVQDAPFQATFRTWLFADAMGLLSIVPLLVGTRREDFEQVLRGSRRAEALGALLLVPATTVAVVLTHDLHWLFLLCPIVLGAAFRLGFLGAALAISLVAASGVLSIAFGSGHPVASLSTVRDHVELLQLFVR